jgi:thiamine transport system permease protein
MAEHMATDREFVRARVTSGLRIGTFLSPLLLVVLLFGLLPPILLFLSGVDAIGGLGSVPGIVQQPLNLDAFSNSLEQGALSAAIAVAVGYPAGVFLGRYEWPGRTAIRGFLLIPFLLPTVVVVLGILDLFGTNGIATRTWPALAVFGRGIPAIVAANLVFNVSIVVLLTAVGVETASGPLEDSVATLGGGPVRAYREVWGPPSWVGAAAAGLLTFIFSALSFAPPLLLCGARCYTLEARVWWLDYTLGDATTSAVLAFVMVLLLVLPTGGYLYLVGRLRARTDPQAVQPRPFPRRSVFAWGLLVETVLVVTGVGILLAALLDRAFVSPSGSASLAGWSDLFGGHTTAVLGISIVGTVENTLFFATSGAVIVLLLAISAGYVLAGRSRLGRSLRFYLFLPLLFSPVVVAFGLASFWRPILGGESMVWVLIILSQTTLALPFALQSLELPLRRLTPTLRESARVLGAPPWIGYVDADLPRARSGLFTAALFAFAFCLGEFTATYFLVTPNFTTLPVAVYNLQSVRLDTVSNAAAGLLILVSGAVFALLLAGGRRVEF